MNQPEVRHHRVHRAALPLNRHVQQPRLLERVVRIDRVPIPAGFSAGDYSGDPAVRKQVQRWLHEQWLRKDELISQILAESRPA